MARGGSRVGAGRKKKVEIDINNINSNLIGEEMPSPSKYLSADTKGASENIAKEVFEKTWKWLKERKCDVLINPNLVEQYSMSVARWVQAEEAVHTFGFLAKHPTTGLPIASPYVKISHDFLKQSTNLWLQIYGVIKEQCAEFYNSSGINAKDDMMEMILSSKPKR